MSRHVKHCQLYLPTCIEVTNTNQRQDKLRYSLIADIPGLSTYTKEHTTYITADKETYNKLMSSIIIQIQIEYD